VSDKSSNCDSPIDAETLGDYWVAGLSESDEQAVEEHLLACDGCGERLREMIALAEGTRNLARQGSLRLIVSDAFLKRAAADGLRVREYAPASGGAVQCTVTDDDDILIARLAANLSGTKRVDLSICDERGVERTRMSDIPVRPSAGSVAWQESISFLKDAPDCMMIARLVGVDDAGAERLLGEYTFNHTRCLPGRGAW
jgi:hypothetical protein